MTCGHRVRVLVAALALATASLAGETRAPDPAGQEEILRRLGRLSGLYHDTALRYTCREVIEEFGHGGKQADRFEFDYIHVVGNFQDLRDHRRRVGPGPQGEVELQNLGISQFLERPYSWVFLFSPTLQPLHQFRLLGGETILDRPALKLEFAPIPPYKAGRNDWFGTAWIDAETSQLLRVEAMQPAAHKEWMRFQERLEERVAAGYRPSEPRFVIEKTQTDFTVVKNGMRFPGRTIISHSIYSILPGQGGRSYRESPIYRVEQAYSDYRFFSVQTEAKIREIVLGAD